MDSSLLSVFPVPQPTPRSLWRSRGTLVRQPFADVGTRVEWLGEENRESDRGVWVVGQEIFAVLSLGR